MTGPTASESILEPGQAFTVDVYVKNQGSVASTATTMKFYKSTNPLISTSDTLMTSLAVPSLNPSGIAPLSTSLPAPFVPETYWVGACITPLAGELITDNQCSAGIQVTVSLPQPDLAVTWAFILDRTLTTGESYSIHTVVKNEGTGLATSSTLRYFQSTDSTISTSDTELAFLNVIPLDVGEESQQSVSPTAPLTTGTYWIGACVDTVTNESDTTNQCSTCVSIKVITLPSLTTGAASNSCNNICDNYWYYHLARQRHSYPARHLLE